MGVPARDVLKSSGVPVAVGVVVKGVRGAASNERDSDVLESRRVLVALMVVVTEGSRRAERDVLESKEALDEAAIDVRGCDGCEEAAVCSEVAVADDNGQLLSWN